METSNAPFTGQWVTLENAKFKVILFVVGVYTVCMVDGHMSFGRKMEPIK